MRQLGLFLCICLMASVTITEAQSDTSSFNTDELFEVGRELAFNQKRERGRFWMYKALEKSPDYHDIRIFVARTFGWDGNYKEASRELQYVIRKEPKNKEAILALIDVYNWSDQADSLLFIADYGLRYYPTNAQFLLAMAKALIEKDQKKDAAVILQQLLSLYPANESAQNLMDELKQELLLNAISVDYGFDSYKTTYGFQQLQDLTYTRVTKMGSINFRLYTAQRFDRFGSQFEIEAYPSLFDKTYAYVSYAYSGTALFPKHRMGLEVFRSLPASFEASLGMRYLKFSSSDVTIYTATLGWYVGNIWLSARTYITPDKDVGAVSKSVSLRGRYYLNSTNTFIGASAGFGFSPESEIEPGSSVYFFRSHKAGLEYQQQIGLRWRLRITGGWFDVELPFDPGTFDYAISASANLEFRF